MRAVLFIVMSLCLSIFAFAAPEDQDIEIRAKAVGHSLRCVVCQNQSIEESDATLAEDMRRLVRSRMKKGDSDAEVIAFMRDRYGDYVLLKPPVQSNTYILWFAPFVLVLLGGVWFFVAARAKVATQEVAPLSDEDRRILDAVLNETD